MSAWIRPYALKEEMHADIVIFDIDESSDMVLSKSNTISEYIRALYEKYDSTVSFDGCSLRSPPWL